MLDERARPFEFLKLIRDKQIRHVARFLETAHRHRQEAMSLTVAGGDNFFTAKSVMSDIWNAMNACRLVIADCAGWNPNVFYELGMAHTLGKPVVLIRKRRRTFRSISSLFVT